MFCSNFPRLNFKLNPAGIYAQSLTENQDLVKHNSIIQRIVKHDFSKTLWVYLFFQNVLGLEIAVLKSHDFSMFEPYEPGPGAGRCGSLVIISSHSLDVYTVDIAVLNILCTLKKSFHGQPRLEYYALSQQNTFFSLLAKKPSLFCFIVSTLVIIFN